ncbi:MAG: tRNA preQ1(34) S-adenosylmethionine ribosyltransferase-isomerase QueA [Pseudomonadota bacterium]
MHLSDFDFELPEDLIALRPLRPRPASRMLVVRPDAQTDAHVRDLPHYLRAGDMLVFNDTRVIPARLRGERRRETTDGSGVAQIEVTLAERIGPDRWRALAKPGKRLKAGDRITFGDGTFSADVAEKEPGGFILLAFSLSGDALDRAVEAAGEMPLPPYIAGRRAADERDREDYQTVFATRPGAVAAPTASLHFDADLLADLAGLGVLSTRVTLHVGAGTFLPVTAERLDDHQMHAEWGEVTEEAARAITAAKAAGGRIIPVGTTALRLIETAAERGVLSPWQGPTDIFIRPGYRFQIADGLMTNFHLPKSTLMMLVSALMGLDRMRDVYAHAIAERYRFFSYGDSSLLLPDPKK